MFPQTEKQIQIRKKLRGESDPNPETCLKPEQLGLCLFYSNTCPCSDLDDGFVKKVLGEKIWFLANLHSNKKKNQETQE